MTDFQWCRVTHDNDNVVLQKHIITSFSMFISTNLIIFLRSLSLSSSSSSSSDLCLGMASSTNENEILHDFPSIRVYKDGRVERLKGTDTVPPSFHPETRVQSKDIILNPQTSLSARIYLPKIINPPQKKLPILIYFHGGGFCIESAFSPRYHRFCDSIAGEANAVVVSVNYRLDPEHPLPIAYNDSWEAIDWIVSHSKGASDELWLKNFGDFDRLFFAGDSAGANIAHNMAIRVGSNGSMCFRPNLVGIVLIHPYFWGKDPIGAEESDLGKRAFWDSRWRFVCPSFTDMDDPLINPVMDPKLSGLGCGNVLICVAEKDRWRDRGWYYYEGLRKSEWGGEEEIMEAKGETHVFHLYNPKSENAVAMLKRIGWFLNTSKA